MTQKQSSTTECYALSVALAANFRDCKDSIRFQELAEEENRYALVVSCAYKPLLNFLAQFFGAPRDTCYQDSFTASDRWHGQGTVNLRDLADEFTKLYGKGEFFDFYITVPSLIAWGQVSHEPLPVHTPPEVKREASVYEMSLLQRIGERAKPLFPELTTMYLLMDLEAVHCNGTPLELHRLLTEFTTADFVHDIGGIVQNIDRTTGKLGVFTPRCALPDKYLPKAND